MKALATVFVSLIVLVYSFTIFCVAGLIYIEFVDSVLLNFSTKVSLFQKKTRHALIVCVAIIIGLVILASLLNLFEYLK